MTARRASTGAARRRARMGKPSSRSPVDEIEEELLHARVVTLTEPEDRLLAEVAVGIVGGDVHQLVDGVAVAALREHKDELILNLGLTLHLVVESNELT